MIPEMKLGMTAGPLGVASEILNAVGETGLLWMTDNG